MKRVISWVIMLPITVVVALFTMENLQNVEIGLWPLDGKREVPLYLVVLLCILFGFIAGGVVAWISSSRRRRRTRELADRNARLQQQVEELRRELATAQAHAAEAARPRAISANG